MAAELGKKIKPSTTNLVRGFKSSKNNPFVVIFLTLGDPHGLDPPDIQWAPYRFGLVSEHGTLICSILFPYIISSKMIRVFFELIQLSVIIELSYNMVSKEIDQVRAENRSERKCKEFIGQNLTE